MGTIEGIIHFRYDGNSHDVPSSEVDIGDNSSNTEVLAALARRFNLPTGALTRYEVERESSGNFTVHPPATFG